MSNITWRREAKNTLYNYYENRRRLKQLEADIIYAQAPHRDFRNRGGASDPTAVKTLLLDKGESGRIKREITAVEQLLQELNSSRRDAKYKRLLLEMVYFRRSNSLYGAAAYLGLAERTAHRWNAKMLRRLAELLGYSDF